MIGTAIALNGAKNIGSGSTAAMVGAAAGPHGVPVVAAGGATVAVGQVEVLAGASAAAVGAAIAKAAGNQLGGDLQGRDSHGYQDLLECEGADHVDWTDHGHKHYPPKNVPWKDVVKSTKGGPAKYSPDIGDIEVFERDAWATGTPTTNGKNWRVKAYDHVIGASDGMETVYVRIENSANTIHGHPITAAEYWALLK